MASKFLLDLERPIGQELRRVLVGQAERGLLPLEREGPTESVVHEARKASKRARAVGRLVRPVLDRKVWRWLDRGFRDAARPLGPLRDADVARKNLGNAAPPRPVDDGLTEGAIAAYQTARSRADALQLHAFDDQHLIDGLTMSWRAARDMGRRASPGDPESFHEWRKAVRQLYYQVQLVQELQGAVLGGLAMQLDVLQESLGDHHDTVVGVDLAGPDAEGIEVLVQRRWALEAQTVPLGRWLFAARPKRFRRWVKETLDARLSASL